MPQLKMQELPSKFKITILSGNYRVEAPLPPDFGFTVGSEYTTPFDMGSISGTLQKLYAVGGISNPVGLRMRKMYANPEPTEISFDMEFAAHHSAKDDVAIPIVTLMVMSLGRVVKERDIEEAIEKMSEMASQGASLFGFSPSTTDQTQQPLIDAETRSNTSRVLDMINLIKAPDPAIIKFGDFIVIDRACITSTGVQFSNILDKDGYPMSGKVSVTATVQIAPIADDIVRFFGGIVGIQ